ncbi:MAG: biotin/lipoyl-containing protein, partial [Daejeonella sp.]|uniref:acetyl-CoA carboxylase biotin carboxyl carrier protein n=1 Tax=Daejeonella sp. TaxID=2805397 RepID=UPI003C77C437
MDIKQIQELIKFVSRSGVNEVSIEQKEFKITIKTNQAPTYVTAAPVQQAPQAFAAPQAPAPAAVSAAPAPQAAVKDETANYITVKSPMIGTFYRSASPDKPLLVNVGDEIKTGQVLC